MTPTIIIIGRVSIAILRARCGVALNRCELTEGGFFSFFSPRPPSARSPPSPSFLPRPFVSLGASLEPPPRAPEPTPFSAAAGIVTKADDPHDQLHLEPGFASSPSRLWDAMRPCGGGPGGGAPYAGMPGGGGPGGGMPGGGGPGGGGPGHTFGAPSKEESA